MRRCPPLRLASFLSSPASRLHPSRGRLQQLLRTERERPLAPLQQRLFVKRRFLSTSAPKSPDCTAGVDFSWVMTFKGAASCASYVLVPYVGVLLFLVAQQRSLIFPRSTRTASIAKSGGELIKLEQSVDDDGSSGQLAALYYPSTKANTPTLVFWHGNADQLGWGPAYLGKHFAASLGVGFYAIEYPGYGYSSGEPSEEGIYAASEALLKKLVTDEDEGGLGVSKEDVILFGQSIGCAVAVEMATKGWGRGLILLAPFKSLPAMVDAAYPIASPFLSVFPFALYDKFDSIGKAEAGKIKMPMVVVHGTEDEIVPYEHGTSLVQAVQHSKKVTPSSVKMVSLEGVGHNELLDNANFPTIEKTIVEFLALVAK